MIHKTTPLGADFMGNSVVGRILAYMVFIFLGAPLLVIIATAFQAEAYIQFPPEGWSWTWIERAFQYKEFQRSLVVSALAAVIVVSLNIVPAFLTSYAIARKSGKVAQVAYAVVMAPLFVPGVLIGLGMLFVLSWLNLLGTSAGIILAYMLVTLPFMVRVLVGTMEAISPQLEQAAAILGANRTRTLLYITLPLSARGLFAAGVIGIVVVFDEAVIINFIGSVNAATFPMQLFAHISTSLDPIASVYASIMIVATLLAVVLVDRLIGFGRFTGGMGVNKGS